MAKIITTDFVKTLFKMNGFTLLTKTYISAHKLLEYECPNKHIGKISYSNFKSGVRCILCYIDNTNDVKFKKISQEFIDAGCKPLFKNYFNNRELLNYYCSCGNFLIQKIKYQHFKRGQRCNECKNERKKKTCLKKFGVEFPNQREDFFLKAQQNSNKYKRIITPNGKEIFLQGFEPSAYFKLLEKYDENEIITERKNIPKIWYKDTLNKQHRYFPDFFIPKHNLIVEVKSKWTYNVDIEKNQLKMDACINGGYNFKFMILDQ